MEVCYICGKETDYHCQDCGEPVCEDCLTPFTLQNQIDYNLCSTCYDGYQARRRMEYVRKEEAKDIANKLRIERNKKASIRYWKPENIEKRRVARQKRRKEQFDQRLKNIQEAISIVNDWFKL